MKATARYGGVGLTGPSSMMGVGGPDALRGEASRLVRRCPSRDESSMVMGTTTRRAEETTAGEFLFLFGVCGWAVEGSCSQPFL